MYIQFPMEYDIKELGKGEWEMKKFGFYLISGKTVGVREIQDAFEGRFIAVIHMSDLSRAVARFNMDHVVNSFGKRRPKYRVEVAG